jgi:hypothetical protein
MPILAELAEPVFILRLLLAREKRLGRLHQFTSCMSFVYTLTFKKLFFAVSKSGFFSYAITVTGQKASV